MSMSWFQENSLYKDSTFKNLPQTIDCNFKKETHIYSIMWELKRSRCNTKKIGEKLWMPFHKQ